MLTLDRVCFSYEKKPVFTDFSMHLEKGEVLAVMGASGCGKTTLLRLAAGLEKPQSGKIICQAKRISVVFQEPRLLPWQNVRDNLLVVSASPQQDRERIPALLEAVGLSGCEKMFPDELSGGMRSRVALARALLADGDLFLLDEPFSALDHATKECITEYLRKYFSERGTSALLITHHKEDAERLATRFLMLS